MQQDTQLVHGFLTGTFHGISTQIYEKKTVSYCVMQCGKETNWFLCCKLCKNWV